MSHELVEPGAVGIDPIFKTESLELAQPLQTEIFERAPVTDFGFHPTDMDAARQSLFWNAFPQPPQTEFFERTPAIDMGIFPPSNVARIRSMDVAEPLQIDVLGKNPTQAVKEPPQCDNMCEKNPTQAVKEPPQCDNMCEKNPTQAVKQPLQCDVCMKNPTEAVRQPQQCDVCMKNPTDAVKQPQQCDVCMKNPTQAVREPLDIECCGPTMSFRLKEDARAEIAIYNVNGRLVRRLSEMLSSGETTLTWDGMDDRGSRAASGVYFARVQADEDTGKGKLVLIR